MRVYDLSRFALSVWTWTRATWSDLVCVEMSQPNFRRPLPMRTVYGAFPRRPPVVTSCLLPLGLSRLRSELRYHDPRW